jgi:hypothetical protein
VSLTRKLDIEGSEDAALRGARHVLEDHLPLDRPAKFFRDALSRR